MVLILQNYYLKKIMLFMELKGGLQVLTERIDHLFDSVNFNNKEFFYTLRDHI